MVDYLLNIGGRDEQQDSCEYFNNRHSTLLVLGDGMGGHRGGQAASETLIAESKYAYVRQKGTIKNPKEFFQSIIDGTVMGLKQYIKENPDSDPHTTCVLALIQNNKLYVGHIGDSRMYLFVDKKFQIRSRDHSVVQMLLNEGEITEDEMATHPDQNKLLKSVSARKDSKITFKEYNLPADKTNAVLLCSDGFWEQLSTDEMQGQLFKKKDIKKALETMVEGARRRGGEDGDNISVVAYVKKGSKLALLFDNQYILKLTKVLMAIIDVLLIVALAIYIFQSDDKKPTPDLNARKIQELTQESPFQHKKSETTPHVHQLSVAHKDKPSIDINDTNNTNSNNTTSPVIRDEFKKPDIDHNSSSINSNQKIAVVTTEDNKTVNEDVKHEVDSDENTLIKHNHLPHTTIIQQTQIPEEAITNNEKNGSE